MSQARLRLPCPTARVGRFSKAFIGSGVPRGGGGAGTKPVPCRREGTFGPFSVDGTRQYRL